MNTYWNNSLSVPIHTGYDEFLRLTEGFENAMFSDHAIGDDLVVMASKTDHPESVWSEVVESRAYSKGISNLAPGSVLVDVGAHIGLVSLHFARTVPDARIYAFEPASASFRCLKENCSRYAPGAHVANFAIGSANGEARLTYYPHRSTMSTLYVDDEEDRHNVRILFDQVDPSPEFRKAFWDRFDRGVRQETVPMTTLTDALSGADIDEISFLKIDVERAELEVLNGLAEDHWAKVRRMAIEVHDRNGRLAEISELLNRHGYRVEQFREKYFSGTDIHMVYADRD
ncbi:hypothetical protein CFP75_03320 [Amycolatopsis alba DSM 44262]|uniref:Methyltransferase FkbM domain-containing protein n=2 Tax=Amycolatopsis alba TaxID=76020 RepID=A0A229S6N6_AMYAL|nr:hypothetical protein CFP75_03320 [Amycolatopsis alba DSM 44262]